MPKTLCFREIYFSGVLLSLLANGLTTAHAEEPRNLTEAVDAGLAIAADLYLTRGESPHLELRDEPLIVYATRAGHFDLCSVLLQHGADPTARTRWGVTLKDLVPLDTKDSMALSYLLRMHDMLRMGVAAANEAGSGEALQRMDALYKEIDPPRPEISILDRQGTWRNIEVCDCLDMNAGVIATDRYAREFRFISRGSKKVQIDMKSEDVDSWLKLISPDGEYWVNDDFESASSNSRLIITLPGDGEYTIVASTYDPRETGCYKLSLFSEDSDLDLRNASFPIVTLRHYSELESHSMPVPQVETFIFLQKQHTTTNTVQRRLTRETSQTWPCSSWLGDYL